MAYVSQDPPAIHAFSFDGVTRHIPIACCDRIYPASIRGNRIIFVDRTGSKDSRLSSARLSGALVGRVYLLDSQGTVLAQSPTEINALLISSAPDDEHFAFVGSTLDQPRVAVYVGKLTQPEVRKVMEFEYSSDPDTQRTWSLDWSPNSRKVLVSQRGRFYSVTIATGATEDLGEGSLATWSPDGRWVSYRNRQHRPALLDMDTRKQRAIEGNHTVGTTMDWSPDGKYVLIPDVGGCFNPEGCHWIYRPKDGSFVPLRELGATNPRKQWLNSFPSKSAH